MQNQLGKLLSGLQGRSAEAVAHLDAARQASGGRADPFEFGAALLEHGAPAPPALRCRGWHWR